MQITTIGSNTYFANTATDPSVNSFNVNYIGFTPEAQTAFDYAVNIWNQNLITTVPIKIDAEFSDLGSGTLGSAGPSNFFANFLNAPKQNIFYPTGLANQLNGSDLNGATGEIQASFSSTANWYYGIDGNTPSNQFDFVTVVLHEIGHGVGFTGLYTSSGALCCSAPFPSIFDTFLENATNTKITALATDAERSSAFTSENLYFNGANANIANGNERVKLFAPTTFLNGSSIYHLDFTTYQNTSNSLMTHAIGMGTARHNVGDIALGILKDEGWTVQVTSTPVPFEFTPLPAMLVIGYLFSWKAYQRNRK